MLREHQPACNKAPLHHLIHVGFSDIVWSVGWQASFAQPPSTAASAAEDIAQQQLRSRLPQAARDQQGEAMTSAGMPAAQMDRAGSAASRHSSVHDGTDANRYRQHAQRMAKHVALKWC